MAARRTSTSFSKERLKENFSQLKVHHGVTEDTEANEKSSRKDAKAQS